MQTLPRNRRWGWWAHLRTQAGRARRTEHSGNWRGSLEMVFSLSHGRRPHELMRWYPEGWVGSGVEGAWADSFLLPSWTSWSPWGAGPHFLPSPAPPRCPSDPLLGSASATLPWTLRSCRDASQLFWGQEEPYHGLTPPASGGSLHLFFFLLKMYKEHRPYFVHHLGSDRECPCNVEDPGSIPVLGRFPGERNGNPHFSILA